MLQTQVNCFYSLSFSLTVFTHCLFHSLSIHCSYLSS
jgi:hypothetical protein